MIVAARIVLIATFVSVTVAFIAGNLIGAVSRLHRYETPEREPSTTVRLVPRAYDQDRNSGTPDTAA